MKISVFGSLRQYTGGNGSVDLSFDGLVSIDQVITMLNIPEEYVYVVEKNGKMIDKSTVIEDEGDLKLLPVIAGG